METKKEFSTLAVAGVYTGRVLEHGGMNGIHEVMDHLYPGIMTIGIAAMADRASDVIGEQLPALAALGKPTDDGWQAYADSVVKHLGPTLWVSGPDPVSKAEISAAFGRMAERQR